ncbi:MAG: GntR family transcriptional regulator [Pseudomonadota bacterium]|nr:GntR family transcriptional regulator [Pseudomonadota bacterium]
MQETSQGSVVDYVSRLREPLDRTSPLPLYAQVRQRLIAMILAWEDREKRFYSDEELCTMFKVSRDTVRQAVSELTQEGILMRSRGLGTFVVAKKLEERFNPSMDFEGQWAANGTPTETTVLVFEHRDVDEQIAHVTGLALGRRVLFIKRVRSAATLPIAIDYRYLPAELAPDWSEEVAQHSPLHKLWSTHNLVSGDFVIESGIAGPEEVELLHLTAGAPVMIRSLRYQDQDGAFCLGGYTVHRGDVVRYSLSVPLVRNGGQPQTGLDQTGVHED